MEWWHAVILGLVEGITEYLPVSSTGHLILASSLMGLNTPEQKSSVDAFNIVIQGGAILAVIGLYWPRIVQMLRGLAGKDERGLRLAVNIVIAFMPAAVLGFLFNDVIERFLFNAPVVLTMLALGGLWMIVIDRLRKRDRVGKPEPTTLDTLTPMKALLIGCFQVVAMVPGTSRSMMTIAGGTMLGLRPKDAAEFSFLLGLPTLGGACVYSLYKNLTESSEAGTANMFEDLGVMNVVIGMAVATVSAAIAIRWLVGFLNTHGLSPFGFYRIGLAAVLGGMVWLGWVGM